MKIKIIIYVFIINLKHHEIIVYYKAFLFSIQFYKIMIY